MTKFKKEDERDRSDNRYGKTELEEKQDAAELNDERRAYVSRKMLIGYKQNGNKKNNMKKI